jgi:hypothetical protein
MNRYQEEYNLIEKLVGDKIYFSNHANFEEVKEVTKALNSLQEAVDKANKYDELKRTLEFSDIYSTNEFYNEYKSCLEGDGTAVFVMKDLTINNDFKTCWKMLKNCVNKYGEVCNWKCEIAFVVWFNR